MQVGFPVLSTFRRYAGASARRAAALLRRLTPGALKRSRRFTAIYRTNAWESDVTRSGPGSTLEETAAIREELPKLVEALGVQLLADVPCGDCAWIRHVPLECAYVGYDIVPEVIEQNRSELSHEGWRFERFDIVRKRLPVAADLVLMRDLLVHLSNADALAALRSVARSGSRYLLTTTFPQVDENVDIETGAWRPVNLERPPFNLPEPDLLISENSQLNDGAWWSRSLALWPVACLPGRTATRPRPARR